jgi:glyoxylase-like metal-dependent hydrolase (beta-lactamase superfamily II)
MAVAWNAGAQDCVASPQPPIQVHRYNPRTFILRENPCATPEAPFLYLLAGSAKALLIDTGDVASAQAMPLAETVMALLPDVDHAKMPLLVVHTHSHLDHRLGDAQFEHLANVQVVPADLAHVQKFFAFAGWPEGLAQIDLGDRVVDAMPTPGHNPNHVSYYDRQTGLFFSGDFFLPGRLIIDDANADLASARRVARFVKDHPVTYVLGGHDEMKASGETVAFGSHYHPDERVLQLSKQDLLALPGTVAGFNGFYGESGGFVVYNQNRILLVAAIILVCVLLLLVVLLRAYLRRRRAAQRTLA